MRRNLSLSVIALPALLAACGTPQQRCINQNTGEYRAVSRLLAQVDGNLARGYAWAEREVTRERFTECRDLRRDADGTLQPVLVPCWREYTETERYRVPIDPAAEQRKRDNLAARQAALAAKAKSAVAACQAAFPETQG
ncbi:hypothetical protein [Paracoccus sp. (in: a-proteobacteria)]|uniref:hypothetical protein n=1 Tax=Paracoccus sp. TaxID=267 RepID=UPI0026DEE2FC|nr:hypothetical protein [Paracoccus sp. (in: a-proteobacteria)]MDO5646535.1 hypothetical protein [Paracoccus sp. (in: a-proteobacteria)]